MVSELHSVSIPEELCRFVEENDFKYSKIIQSAILRIMEDYKENPIITRLQMKNTILTKELEKYSGGL